MLTSLLGCLRKKIISVMERMQRSSRPGSKPARWWIVVYPRWSERKAEQCCGVPVPWTNLTGRQGDAEKLSFTQTLGTGARERTLQKVIRMVYKVEKALRAKRSCSDRHLKRRTLLLWSVWYFSKESGKVDNKFTMVRCQHIISGTIWPHDSLRHDGSCMWGLSLFCKPFTGAGRAHLVHWALSFHSVPSYSLERLRHSVLLFPHTSHFCHNYPSCHYLIASQISNLPFFPHLILKGLNPMQHNSPLCKVTGRAVQSYAYFKFLRHNTFLLNGKWEWKSSPCILESHRK